MNKSDEVLFFEYLDKAVNWERDKQEKLKHASKPFKNSEIISLIEDVELEKLKSTKDCVERMKMLKVIHSVFARRLFLIMVRENFENIDFSQLKQSSVYNNIKAQIFQSHPDLTFVEDDKFLRQIGNAFAHGNYLKLFDMKILEEMYVTKNEENIDFAKREKTNLFTSKSMRGFEDSNAFNDKSNNLIVKTREAIKGHKVSSAHFLINLLSSNKNKQFEDMETLEFKYESNLMLDADGNVVRRPSTAVFNLKISREQLEMLTFLLIAERNVYKCVVPESDEVNKRKNIPHDMTDEDTAKCFLDMHKFYLYDESLDSQEAIELDDHQKQALINEYVDARKWFGKEFFKAFNDMLQEIWATNQNSHVLLLNSLLASDCRAISATDLMIENVENVFDVAEYNFKKNFSFEISESVASWGEYISQVKQIFNSYTESLITELLLLFEIIEDKQLLQDCENSEAIKSIVASMNQQEMSELRNSSKYRTDEHSVIYHLRNSFCHLNYLNNLNKELFVYDYVSKRNKNKVFKFTISIENLEKIKDELLKLVCEHLVNASSQADLSNNI
jgi:hypothetical protein